MDMSSNTSERQLEILWASINKLEKFRNLSEKEFLQSQDILDIVSYRSIILISGCAKISVGICSKNKIELQPADENCFTCLESLEIIPSELSRKLEQVTKVMKPLVHRYWDVDYALVYEFIQNDLGIIKEFITIVQTLV